MKQLYFLLIILVFFLSCKSTREPIVYNKDVDIIEKEGQIIHQLIQDGNFEEAERQLEKNFKLYPDNVELLLYKGWLLLRQEKLDESEALFNSLLEKSKRNPLAIAGLARIYRLRGDKERAGQSIELGISLLPNFSIFWLEKGILQYEEKDFQKAYVDFTRAYNLDPTMEDAYFFKYLCLLEMEREFDEVKHYWERISKRFFIRDWYYLYHAETLYRKGMRDEALLIANEGVQKFPENYYLLNITSYILIEYFNEFNDKEMLELAGSYLEKVLEMDVPPEVLDTYFLYLKAAGREGEIKPLLNRYLLLYPEAPVFIDWLKKISE